MAEFKIQTYADKLRSLSNEEMAKWCMLIAPVIAKRYTDSVAGMIEYLNQPYDAKNQCACHLENCSSCMVDAPYPWCCPRECQEHEFCYGCSYKVGSHE